ncbi:MAG: DegT/DnrJ/EryC1/StrS family aminotransferase [Microthrixaceae bacterium]
MGSRSVTDSDDQGSDVVVMSDVAAGVREIRPEIDRALTRVLRSGTFVLGTEVAAFEAEFAESVGARHCVGVGNGTDALRIALEALGIGVGDEVIVPSNAHIAAWLAVAHSGAVPVAVEPDPSTMLLDPDRTAAAITPRTAAVIPVHLYGAPAPMDRLIPIARRHGLAVVEDAAQAHGASLDGAPIGAHGDLVCWSFYPSKNLGALGDGGAVTTNDADLATAVARLGNYGSTRRDRVERLGWNSRLDELQASVLRTKLPHLQRWNSARRAVARRYLAELSALPGIICPTSSLDDSCWHLFVIRSSYRDELQVGLSHEGVQCQIHYPIPPYRQPAFLAAFSHIQLPVADRLSEEVLSIPLHPFLVPNKIDRVVASIATIAQQFGDQ